MTSDLLALVAIVLWGSLAALGVSLAHVPPFLLTGLALLAGSLIAVPLSRGRARLWRAPWPTLAVGVYGLFGFHFTLFLALRHAPPVEANLINYLWPLGIVVMAPLFVPGMRLHRLHLLSAVMGFAGAAIAIAGGSDTAAPLHLRFEWGYVLALVSAFIWASYSLLLRRMPPFPSPVMGTCAALSGLLSLACHAWLEPATSLSLRDALLIAVMGLGPLGGAFYVWDAALKQGDPRRIGLLSFLTPLLSTGVLLWTQGKELGGHIAWATALIVGAAWLGSRVREPRPGAGD